MIRSLALWTAAALLLAACGEQATDNQSADGVEADSGFGASFDKSFAESFLKSCIAGATQKGVSTAQATEVCSCARDGVMKLDRTKRVTLSDAELGPIMESCLDNR